MDYEKQLRYVFDIISNDTYNLGDKFFTTIVKNLNHVLDADYTFIGELINHKSIQTIAVYSKEGVVDNFEYDLLNTPCNDVLFNKVCSYNFGITELYPNDKLLKDMNIEGYIGIPMYDMDKKPIGILVSLYKKPIQDMSGLETILMLFASRASAELVHDKLYKELEYHKNNLEKIVVERTNDLDKKNRELIRTNKKLIKALKDLKKIQFNIIQSEKMASLGVLMGGVAHEINNPLNFIFGSYNYLTNYFKNNKPNDDTLYDYLTFIKQGVDRISNIVKTLNEFTRNGHNFKETCDVKKIIDDCIILLMKGRFKKINFVLNYDEEVEYTVMGNIGKLHHALINVLDNAFKAVVEKPNSVVEVTLKKEENFIIMSIYDDGYGIPEKDLVNIYDPFFTTRPIGEGTGLGLSISYKLISEHNGIIKHESLENNYTVVTIKLPINNEK